LSEGDFSSGVAAHPAAILAAEGQKTAADPKVGGCVKNTGWRLNQPVQPKSEMAVSRSLTS
jgi:hypothetical protein